MSGIGAICRWDGGPLDKPLASMSAALQPLAVDGLEEWSDGRCGLLHAHHWTLPEDVNSSQPATSPGGDCHIVFDGRLDNRAELLSEIGRDIPHDVPTDAQVVAAAYERWTEECPARLLGDFAFVIWDASARQLFAARDMSGVRPLFYLDRPDQTVVASTIVAAARGAGGRIDINRDVVRDVVVSLRGRWVHETVWKPIFRVPPAHSLTVAVGRSPRLRRYRVMSACPDPPRTPEGWREAFAHTFRASVQSRMRSRSPIVVLGGGGLDSSAIFCQAASLSSHHAGLPDVSLLGGTFANTPGADEREYFRAIPKRWPTARYSELPCDDCLSDPVDNASDEGLYEPNVWLIPAFLRSLFAEARKQDAGVVLGGQGGDDVLYSGSYWRAAVLHDWPPRARISEVRYFETPPGRLALELLVGPLLRIVRPLKYPAALSPGPLPTFAAKEGYRSMSWWTIAGYPDRLAVASATVKVDYRMPFLDRRLIELMLAAPMSERCRGGVTKLLLREVLADVLPPELRSRPGKAQFSHLAVKGLLNRRTEVLGLMNSSVLRELGLVNMSHLRACWENFEQLPTYPSASLILWFCSTERWIRRFGESL